MKSSVNIALGIDINESHISAVVLKKTARGLKAISADHTPLPEGVIEAGHVVDAGQLATLLKTVKRRHRVRSKDVAVSLPVGSTLARVVSLEESDPQRIAQFVDDEVRQYAAFSGRETVSDYQVLSPARGHTPGKALVTAADRETALAITRACQRAGIAVTKIAPAVTACTSLFDSTEALGPRSGNRMLAVLKDRTLLLSVFRNGVLDFVHAKKAPSKDSGLSALSGWVAAEISAVVGSYSFQVAEPDKPWTVVVVDDDNAEVSSEAQVSLRAAVQTDRVEVLTQANHVERLGVASRTGSATSITAMGLAMKSVASAGRGMGINLLPEGADRTRVLVRHVLMAANIAAALVLATVLVIGGLAWMAERVNDNIAGSKMKELRSGVPKLPATVAELNILKERITATSAELDCIAQIGASQFDADWVQLLRDIRNAVPEVVRITELSVDGTSEMIVEGLSKTYADVRVFRDSLMQSDHIGQTKIEESGVDRGDQEYVRYTIKCTLVAREDLSL